MKKSVTGSYRTKITLQFPDGTKMVDGIEVQNYVDGAEVYADFDVKPPKSKQLYIAQAEQTIATRWVRIRYIVGVTSKWQVKLGNEIFNIVSPPLDEGLRHRELYLELEAVE